MRDYGFGRRSELLEGVVQHEVQYIINILRNGVALEQDKVFFILNSNHFLFLYNVVQIIKFMFEFLYYYEHM